MKIEMIITETITGKYKASILSAPWIFAEADTIQEAKSLLEQKIHKIAVSVDWVKSSNIVPWYIIAQEALAENLYNLSFENSPEKEKYAARYQALRDLARQLHPWED